MLRISKTRYKRTAPTTVAAVLAAAAAVCVGPTAPVHAASTDVECAGAFSRTFSPAVTVASQTVTVTDSSDYNTCVVGCLLGTPISSTTGLIDSLVLTQ